MSLPLPVLFVAIFSSLPQNGAQREYPKLSLSATACRGGRDFNQWGICMFNYECHRRAGAILGPCTEGFLIGACCGGIHNSPRPGVSMGTSEPGTSSSTTPISSTTSLAPTTNTEASEIFQEAQEFWQHFFQSKAETERPESTRRAPSRATTTFPPPTTVKERASPPPTIILPIAEDENLSSSEERNPSLLLPVLPEAPLAWTVRQPPTAVIRPTTTTSHSPNRISTWSYVDGPANASGVIVSSEKPLSTSATERSSSEPTQSITTAPTARRTATPETTTATLTTGKLTSERPTTGRLTTTRTTTTRTTTSRPTTGRLTTAKTTTARTTAGTPSTTRTTTARTTTAKPTTTITTTQSPTTTIITTARTTSERPTTVITTTARTTTARTTTSRPTTAITTTARTTTARTTTSRPTTGRLTTARTTTARTTAGTPSTTKTTTARTTTARPNTAEVVDTVASQQFNIGPPTSTSRFGLVTWSYVLGQDKEKQEVVLENTLQNGPPYTFVNPETENEIDEIEESATNRISSTTQDETTPFFLTTSRPFINLIHLENPLPIRPITDHNFIAIRPISEDIFGTNNPTQEVESFETGTEVPLPGVVLPGTPLLITRPSSTLLITQSTQSPATLFFIPSVTLGPSYTVHSPPLTATTPPSTTTSSTTTTTTTTTTTAATTASTTSSTTSSTTTPRPNWDYRTNCGVRMIPKQGRIVGGTKTHFGDWPWTVLVKESTWLGLFTKNKCGGVLLNHKYVVTAAHCQPGFLASLTVVLGEFDLTGNVEPMRTVERNVKRIIVHRDYDPKTFENDIALLELASPVEYRPHVVPICLPDDNEDFVGKKALVAGWGRTKYGGTVPDVLMQVEVPIMTNSECQAMFYKAGHPKAIRESFMCAGYPNGERDSCEGDSGGPLMLQREDGRWELAGTVSHGIKCAWPNLPGIYMKMTYYKPWILRVIES